MVLMPDQVAWPWISTVFVHLTFPCLHEHLPLHAAAGHACCHLWHTDQHRRFGSLELLLCLKQSGLPAKPTTSTVE